jgi:hypothetical protein
MKLTISSENVSADSTDGVRIGKGFADSRESSIGRSRVINDSLFTVKSTAGSGIGPGESSACGTSTVTNVALLDGDFTATLTSGHQSAEATRRLEYLRIGPTHRNADSEPGAGMGSGCCSDVVSGVLTVHSFVIAAGSIRGSSEKSADRGAPPATDGILSSSISRL